VRRPQTGYGQRRKPALSEHQRAEVLKRRANGDRGLPAIQGAEKISGARADRPELAKVMRSLGHGDVLLVTRLDRLARSTRGLLNVLADTAKAGAALLEGR
jgi:DNA invertase Pin-like site-specific DNA recombinase